MANSYMFDEARNLVTYQNLQKNLINIIYPVGSIYLSTSSIDPSTFMNGTKWQRVGAGQTMVGVKDGSTEFAANKTGGSRNPKAHEHKIVYEGTVPQKDMSKQLTDNYIYADYATTETPGITPHGSEVHYAITADQAATYQQRGVLKAIETVKTYDAGSTKDLPGVNNPLKGEKVGSEAAGAGFPPYFTVYMWKRVS